ncbi:MAG: hypothetical protein DI606_16375 [Sphingobium sp.]|uniref:hypothetical protein n=1 Tax=Sphingobium sp. TaxID=1912891 RepID=UPI000DB20158|nr:hypothetical protein [Sphingobium sp.]PZU07657.1 MAG: hypothetical protein DI606_16375 [Sphingobium sp.]
MADWKSLTDKKLKAKFEETGPDPRAAEKLRARFSKSLDTALNQFLATEPTRGKKSWKAANNIVEFKPTFGGEPVALDGDTTLYIPSERFDAFIKALKASVEAGELDDALNGVASTKSVSGGKASTRAASSDPLTNIRRAFGIRMGKQKQSAAQAAAALKADGKYDAADIDKVLAEKK